VVLPDLPALRRRLLWTGSGLVVLSGVLAGLVIDARAGLSVTAGGALAAVNLAWTGAAMERMLLTQPERARRSATAGYLLRLMLILLVLYATIRLHFLSAPAAVAGFAVFYCSIFVEGVLEALASFRR
jgi:hypothetical protein